MGLQYVSFAYNPDEPMLQDILFHADPGDRIAIVRPIGVGKTTWVSLILRFYTPSHGEISFDEPTSALDRLVEKSIFDVLPDFINGKTVFVVAHRRFTG
jgi:ATP-binding cassette subfamily B multidrug efflux pump